MWERVKLGPPKEVELEANLGHFWQICPPVKRNNHLCVNSVADWSWLGRSKTRAQNDIFGLFGILKIMQQQKIHAELSQASIFVVFFTEETVFVMKLNDITTFHISKGKKFSSYSQVQSRQV